MTIFTIFCPDPTSISQFGLYDGRVGTAYVATKLGLRLSNNSLIEKQIAY